MEEKPTTAFTLSLIGGILVLFGGIALASFGTLVAFFTMGLGLILWIFAIFGIIIIIGSITMRTAQPQSIRTWGIVILILGIISLIGILTTLGGILSIIAGILAIAWKPKGREAPPPPPSQAPAQPSQAPPPPPQ